MNLELWEQILTLVTGLVGLISAGIGIYFGVKSAIQKMKAQTKEQNWQLIMSIADKAMATAEKSLKEGAEKKEMAIEIVKAAMKEAGIEGDDFMDQLSAYIDNAIAFANSIKKSTSKK